jgi:hypothetical protein
MLNDAFTTEKTSAGKTAGRRFPRGVAYTTARMNRDPERRSGHGKGGGSTNLGAVGAFAVSSPCAFTISG